MKIIASHKQKHQCKQIWSASPEKIFPLLCPVREMDWIPEWAPKLVISDSGVMEPGCIFIEPGTLI